MVSFDLTYVLFLLIICLFVSRITNWPRTHYIAKHDFGSLFRLLLSAGVYGAGVDSRASHSSLGTSPKPSIVPLNTAIIQPFCSRSIDGKFGCFNILNTQSQVQPKRRVSSEATVLNVHDGT